LISNNKDVAVHLKKLKIKCSENYQKYIVTSHLLFVMVAFDTVSNVLFTFVLMSLSELANMLLTFVLILGSGLIGFSIPFTFDIYFPRHRGGDASGCLVIGIIFAGVSITSSFIFRQNIRNFISQCFCVNCKKKIDHSD